MLNRLWPRSQRCPVYLRRCVSRLGGLGLQPGIGQLLEVADVVNRAVAEILQRLADQCRAPTRGTIDQDRLVLLEGGIVVRALRVGAEFEYAARDVDRALDLAARLH